MVFGTGAVDSPRKYIGVKTAHKFVPNSMKPKQDSEHANKKMKGMSDDTTDHRILVQYHNVRQEGLRLVIEVHTYIRLTFAFTSNRNGVRGAVLIHLPLRTSPAPARIPNLPSPPPRHHSRRARRLSGAEPCRPPRVLKPQMHLLHGPYQDLAVRPARCNRMSCRPAPGNRAVPEREHQPGLPSGAAVRTEDRKTTARYLWRPIRCRRGGSGGTGRASYLLLRGLAQEREVGRRRWRPLTPVVLQKQEIELTPAAGDEQLPVGRKFLDKSQVGGGEVDEHRVAVGQVLRKVTVLHCVLCASPKLMH